MALWVALIMAPLRTARLSTCQNAPYEASSTVHASRERREGDNRRHGGRHPERSREYEGSRTGKARGTRATGREWSVTERLTEGEGEQ